jgi:hypothetical protein
MVFKLDHALGQNEADFAAPHSARHMASTVWRAGDGAGSLRSSRRFYYDLRKSATKGHARWRAHFFRSDTRPPRIVLETAHSIARARSSRGSSATGWMLTDPIDRDSASI